MDTSDNIEEANDTVLDSSPTMTDENQDNFLSETEENKEKSSYKNSYKVLARKYRPQNFEDLMGQEIMVQTLKNAFKTNRIAHAYILTGVRGIGKTTTARLLAR